jgi:hypothetical protein
VTPIAPIEWVTADDTCDTIELPEALDDAGGVRACGGVCRRCLPSLTHATTTCYY